MTPNPGSDEAGALGCICPVLDNCHGKFPPYPPDGWVIHFGCPVHHANAIGQLARELLTDDNEDEPVALWAVHVGGPDDLIAATDRADADAKAAQINDIATLLRNRLTASEPAPHLRAVVIPSPWSAEDHAVALARQSEYTPADFGAWWSIATASVTPAAVAQLAAPAADACADCGHSPDDHIRCWCGVTGCDCAAWRCREHQRVLCECIFAERSTK